MSYCGMSDRAYWAHEEGKKTYSQLAAWRKRAVDAGAVYANEWHHTGAAFNRTYFYKDEDFEGLIPSDFPPIKKSRYTYNVRHDKPIIITGNYDKSVPEYYGKFGKKRYREEIFSVENQAIFKKNGRIFSVLDDVGVQKRLTSLYSVKVRFTPKHCKKERTLTLEDFIEKYEQ